MAIERLDRDQGSVVDVLPAYSHNTRAILDNLGMAKFHFPMPILIECTPPPSDLSCAINESGLRRLECVSDL